ncbi:MAG: hypothetical protein AAGD25_07930 [Cyanobacteria bacterium P01_F01_bin.150]
MHGHPTPRRHYQLLAIIMGVAIILRVWHLGTKPLWLDEVIGAIFTLGRGLDDVPLGIMFPLTELTQIFSLHPGLSCSQIAQTVATESVHPPLFFCLQYVWISHWLPILSASMPFFRDAGGWVWVLRSLPALIGIAEVCCIYLLGRMVKGPRTGLIAAALMAISPFAVYLSQEARHYTLPMLWTILGLMALVRIQQLMINQRALPLWLLAIWISVNSLGLYTHYFFLLDFVAQAVAIGGWIIWDILWGDGILSKSGKRLYQYIVQLGLSLAVVIVSYAPWIPTLLQHINRPETDWLKPYKPDWSDRIAPLYQTIMGWILMVISLPVESQPLAIAIPSVLIMVVFSIWLGWQIIRGLRQAWNGQRDRPAIQLFLLLMASLTLQMLAIVYILDKDITAIPRYNFISYPIVLILITLALTPQPKAESKAEGRRQKAEEPTPSPSQEGNRSSVTLQRSNSSTLQRPNSPKSKIQNPKSNISLLLFLSGLSSLLVVHGVVFQKGYFPAQVAHDMTRVPEESLLVAVSYRSLQEVALGLSFALEIEKRYPVSTDSTNSHVSNIGEDPAYFMFIDRSKGFGPAWQQLENAPHDQSLPINLWAIASPGMKTKDYPPTLAIRRPNRKSKLQCEIDPDAFYRIGFPYQLFRCAR